MTNNQAHSNEWEKQVQSAYVTLRTHNSTIPDDVLDKMKQVLLTAPEQPRQQADTLNAMLWLYRRLPRAYGRPPFIEQPINALAAATGEEVAGFMAERDEVAAQPIKGVQVCPHHDRDCGDIERHWCHSCPWHNQSAKPSQPNPEAEEWVVGDDYEPSDSLARAGINIGRHGNAIECFSESLLEAQSRRDRILALLQSQATQPSDDALIKAALEESRDAALWRGLINSARIRPLGCAGLKEPEAQYNAHLGLELWTVFGAGGTMTGEQRERLAKENVLGREWLTKYAQIAADPQAIAALIQKAGKP